METPATNNIKNLHFRASLPRYVRYGALAILAVILVAVGIGYLRARSKTEFRMAGFPSELSKDVVAVVEGYERKEIEGTEVKYYIKADKATTFSDNHQELENVFLQVFDSSGAADEVTAAKAVYVPGENKTFTGYFAGEVNVKTRDQLRLRSDQITYSKASETVTADEAVTFERMNVRGRSFGAVVYVAQKRVELNHDVQFEFVDSSGVTSTVSAGNAEYDQASERVSLRNSVHYLSRTGAATFEMRADQANIELLSDNTSSLSVRLIDLTNNVQIDRIYATNKLRIVSGSAKYDITADRFELFNSVNLETTEIDVPMTALGEKAVFESGKGSLTLSGNANLKRGNDLVKGDEINANFFENNSIKDAVVRGNAFVSQTSAETRTEITAPELAAYFEVASGLRRAASKGTTEIATTPLVPSEYSRLSIVATSGITAFFRGEGQIEDLVSEGRTTVKFDMPDNGNDSSNRQVSADKIKTIFWPDGRNMRTAEAIGNAELLILPHRAAATTFRVRVNAPRFDCDFFTTGNSPQVCKANGGSKAFRTPTVQREGRGEQVIDSNKLTVNFSQSSRQIERLEAQGDARFTELDRTARSSNLTFTSSDEFVRLLGGEPVAWDQRSRLKAKEIDWDTKNEISYYRDSVSATFYDRSGFGKTAPFADKDKPVFVTANAAEINHADEVITFSGNARAWQGNNYVRSNTLTVYQDSSKLVAEGDVQSLIYRSGKDQSKESEPIFATSGYLNYDGTNRVVRYERGVVFRRGNERMSGTTATVYHNDSNELIRTDLETNVVIEQPKRRAAADFAQYTVADERVLLRGNPARVDDSERGTSQGSELTMFLKDNRVTGEGRSKVNPGGRTRSTYKVGN